MGILSPFSRLPGLFCTPRSVIAERVFITGMNPSCSGRRWANMDNKIHNEPSDVNAEEGQVDQDGPDGVAVSFEPGAALETGRKLIEKGVEAKRQKRGQTDERRPS